MKLRWVAALGLAGAALALLVGCGGGIATDERHASFPVDGRPSIAADVPKGNISLTASVEAKEIAVTATITVRGRSASEAAQELDRLPLTLTGELGEIVVRLDAEAGPIPEDVTVDLEITSPVDVDVALRTGRGDLYASGISGTVIAHSQRGDVELRRMNARVEATSARGTVVFRGRPADGESMLRSSGGRVEVWFPNDACLRIVAETTDGKIVGDNVVIRGSRTDTKWDARTYCSSSGGGFAVESEPPATVRATADPGNVYLVSWFNEEDT